MASLVGKPWVGALRSLPLWIAAAWVMSLSTLGFMVVPMLFAHLPSPAIAGAMAARLFGAQTAVSAVCAVVLMLICRAPSFAVEEALARVVIFWALAGAVLALWVHFGVSPRIMAKDDVALWHTVGSALYFLQWLCALITFGQLARSRTVSS